MPIEWIENPENLCLENDLLTQVASQDVSDKDAIFVRLFKTTF
jgi:hypothetical protein